jgi:hypothetical protein
LLYPAELRAQDEHRHIPRFATNESCGIGSQYLLRNEFLAGGTIWIADAHHDDGKRFVVRADQKLTAFLELESVIRACGELA